ncbi:MAG TPA: hypothetical protein VGR79_05455 [Stellaceae bacterium]|nr:hypothetical protein [Stellaceae bacterium]
MSNETAFDEVDLTDQEPGQRGNGMTAQPDFSNPALPLLLTLLDDFEREDVAYCYWKSSRRVYAALAGETDLDLLVDRIDRNVAERLLTIRGYKFCPPIASRDHPALASYIGYDDPTGRLVHVHLHFNLVSGAALLRDYRLPWEAIVLARAVRHRRFPIRILDPATEALLTIVRSALELRLADPVAVRHWSDIRQKFALDREAVAARLDPATFRERVSEIFESDVADVIVESFFAQQPLERQTRLRRRIRKALAPHRAYNCVEVHLRSWARAVDCALRSLNRRFLHAPRPWNRRAPGGGRVVAVIGVDGSGKSTITATIRDWLGAEVDVMPIYFGTGDGRPSLAFRPFKMIVPLVTWCLRTKPRGASHGRISDRPPGIFYSTMMMVWATAVAMEKRGKLRATQRGASRGLVVVADRYPQDEDLGYSDGPLLPRLAYAPGWLRRFETRCYALARRLPPDLVLKLEVKPKTVARREPDMHPAVIRQRIAAAHGLAFPGARVARVNAERPLEDVIRAAKREIWSLI